MQFVETKDGTYINLREVSCIKPKYTAHPKSGKTRLSHYELWTREGNMFHAHPTAVSLAHMMGTVVAAGPSDYLIQVQTYDIIGDDNQKTQGVEFNRLKIVAWRVDGLSAMPVVYGEPDDMSGMQYVETADGKYDSTYENRYDSLDDLKAAYTPKAPVKTND